jgi:uncharacterized protein YutD
MKSPIEMTVGTKVYYITTSNNGRTTYIVDQWDDLVVLLSDGDWSIDQLRSLVYHKNESFNKGKSEGISEMQRKFKILMGGIF